KLSSGLQDFVSQYNAVRAQLNAQVGPAAGLLSGDTLVQQLQSELRNLVSYRSSTGSVKNLADLGVEFSSSGEASFNAAKFDTLSSTNVSDGLQFVQSADAGFGGFSKSLAQFSDSTGGLIKTEQQGLDRIDANLQKQIAALNDRISVMQNSLN